MLLDTDAIAEMMADAFGGIYGEGEIIRRPLTDDGKGGWIVGTPVKYPIQLQIDQCTEKMREAAGYTENDVALIILRHGVGTQELNSDDEISSADGRKWHIFEVGTDAARSHWIGRGVEIR